jgi:hypothetical protein
MKPIKTYFKGWDAARILRMVLGTCLLAAYYYQKETLFLFAGVMLSMQAVFNLSCMGGSCSTPASNDTKPVMKFKKYEPEK